MSHCATLSRIVDPRTIVTANDQNRNDGYPEQCRREHDMGGKMHVHSISNRDDSVARLCGGLRNCRPPIVRDS